MSTHTLPVTEARARLPQLVKAADERFDRTVITSNGRPTAVLISYDEYEAWEETLEVLSDSEAMRSIREADEELAAGKAVSFEAVFGHKQPKAKKTK
jgi:antitoxin YefM